MGEAMARELARRGYRLCLLARSEAVEALGDELGAIALRGDVTAAADLERLVGTALDTYGRVDAVVNNTGHPSKGELLAIPDSDWHAGLDMIFLNVVRMARLVTPIMERPAVAPSSTSPPSAPSSRASPFPCRARSAPRSPPSPSFMPSAMRRRRSA